MSSFPVFNRCTVKVKPTDMMLIWVSLENRTCKRIWVVFPVCSQPVLLRIEFHCTPRFYVHSCEKIIRTVHEAVSRVRLYVLGWLSWSSLPSKLRFLWTHCTSASPIHCAGMRHHPSGVVANYQPMVLWDTRAETKWRQFSLKLH